jgi:hypothetical protein
MMASSFSLSETQFGIQQDRVRIRLWKYVTGESAIYFDISGDENIINNMEKSDDWSWATYPPSVYVHEVAIPAEIAKNGGELVIPGVAESEFGFYFHEYCDVKNFTLRLRPGHSLEVYGTVDISGKYLPFRVHCDDAEWDMRIGVVKERVCPPKYPVWKLVRDWIYERRWMMLVIAVGFALAVWRQRT